MDVLVKKAQCGDAEAFIALVEECKSTLQRVAYGYFGNDEDAADAIQDTILAAYEHLDTLRRGEYFKTWLVRILINNCTRYGGRKKRNISLDSPPKAEQTEWADLESADMVLFLDLLYSLPEESRVIFQLYYGEQFTTREIAAILNMKKNTVKSRLHRGKEKLRVEL